LKKIIGILLAAALLLLLLCGCGSKSKEKLSVVTTIFPEYDWVMQILGDEAENADVTMLLDNGVDLHSYQPTAADLIQISTCDLFIYVGGESDKWADDALREATNQDMVVIDLLDVLGVAVKEEALVEGMEEETDEEESDEAEYDEHIWLSLTNAATCCNAIRDALCRIDGENAAVYTANTDTYAQSLSELDTKYKEMVNSAERTTILFGDRFPFRYLADDYGLTYYAAFAGCSAESEASFETVAFLAEKVDALALPAVLTLEGSNQKIAQTIVSTSRQKNAEILSMDSMQSTTAQDIKNGVSYLSIMEKNLAVLQAALN